MKKLALIVDLERMQNSALGSNVFGADFFHVQIAI